MSQSNNKLANRTNSLIILIHPINLFSQTNKNRENNITKRQRAKQIGINIQIHIVA